MCCESRNSKLVLRLSIFRTNCYGDCKEAQQTCIKKNRIPHHLGCLSLVSAKDRQYFIRLIRFPPACQTGLATTEPGLSSFYSAHGASNLESRLTFLWRRQLHSLNQSTIHAAGCRLQAFRTHYLQHCKPGERT